MAHEKTDEIKKLKNDYFNLIETRREERETLIKVINTFSALIPARVDIHKNLQPVKDLITPDGDLALYEIEQGIRDIKDKIIADEIEDQTDEFEDPMLILQDRVLEACRTIKRIMADILDDFYPIPDEMKAEAEGIDIDCKGDLTSIDLRGPSDDLMNFMQSIKRKISNDFKDINRSFFSMLEQVKDLETSLAGEFGGEGPIKQIEYFEMKISNEVGSIAESFTLYKTINEVKAAVIDKLRNIQEIVALKKKDELKRTRIAQESILTLKKRVRLVEKAAHDMSKRAKKFQTAAMRDSLTGLFNRNEFDLKVKDTLKSFAERGERFSIIIFDVDKFKNINDTFGHVAGDKVLKKVAECLNESFRKDDFLARYGGDEFVVIIEGLTKEMAEEKIRNFKNNLKKKRFVSHQKGEIKLTVSAGITMVVQGDTAETLLERADQAMYAIKQKNA